MKWALAFHAAERTKNDTPVKPFESIIERAGLIEKEEVG
jgi:hypothetical protein